MKEEQTSTILPPSAQAAYEFLMGRYIHFFEVGAPTEIEMPANEEDVNRLAAELAADKGYDFTLNVRTQNPTKEGSA